VKLSQALNSKVSARASLARWLGFYELACDRHGAMIRLREDLPVDGLVAVQGDFFYAVAGFVLSSCEGSVSCGLSSCEGSVLGSVLARGRFKAVPEKGRF